jgi:YcaO cyclodehydratase, ATP-ad Mg2+-binding
MVIAHPSGTIVGPRIAVGDKAIMCDLLIRLRGALNLSNGRLPRLSASYSELARHRDLLIVAIDGIQTTARAASAVFFDRGSGIRPICVQPLPGRAFLEATAPSLQRSFIQQPRLVDPVCGIVARTGLLRRITGEPPDFRMGTADVSRIDTDLQWRPDPIGTGAVFAPDDPIPSAIGEAVERYSGNYVSADLLRASESDLIHAGRDHVRLAEIYQYSEEQRSEPHFPFERPAATMPIEWVPAQNLRSGRTVLIAADAVHLNYGRRRMSLFDTRPFGHLQYAGIAAGNTLQQATEAALLEVIERHVTMLWWHAGRGHAELLSG